MNLESFSFKNGQEIPKKYGYKFENSNPPLAIINVPSLTKSIVLIMDDPDAMAAVGKDFDKYNCDMMQCVKNHNYEKFPENEDKVIIEDDVGIATKYPSPKMDLIINSIKDGIKHGKTHFIIFFGVLKGS